MNNSKKLAFSTLGCPGWDFDTIVHHAASMGFQGIEIRGIGNELSTERLSCFQPGNRSNTQKLLKENGISICGLGTSATFHSTSLYDRSLAEGKAAVDICAAMGIPFLRVFGDIFPPEENREEVILRVTSGIGELCAYAETHHSINGADKEPPVQILLEVHGEFNTVETLSAVAEKLQAHPAFGLIWDVEHSYRAYGKDFNYFYRMLEPYIRHVHIKDCRLEAGNAICLPPGKGEIPLEGIIHLLQTAGYAGYYSLEWEKRWYPELEEPENVFPDYVEFMHSL